MFTIHAKTLNNTPVISYSLNSLVDRAAGGRPPGCCKWKVQVSAAVECAEEPALYLFETIRISTILCEVVVPTWAVVVPTEGCP